MYEVGKLLAYKATGAARLQVGGGTAPAVLRRAPSHWPAHQNEVQQAGRQPDKCHAAGETSLAGDHGVLPAPRSRADHTCGGSGQIIFTSRDSALLTFRQPASRRILVSRTSVRVPDPFTGQSAAGVRRFAGCKGPIALRSAGFSGCISDPDRFLQVAIWGLKPEGPHVYLFV